MLLEATLALGHPPALAVTGAEATEATNTRLGRGHIVRPPPCISSTWIDNQVRATRLSLTPRYPTSPYAEPLADACAAIGAGVGRG